jgi:hypothetical protein
MGSAGNQKMTFFGSHLVAAIAAVTVLSLSSKEGQGGGSFQRSSKILGELSAEITAPYIIR